MNRILPAIGALLATACALPSPSPTPTPWEGTTCSMEAARPDPDLYCIHLTPAPDFTDAAGSAHMMPARSPFGVAVDVNGTHVYDVTVAVAGLPPASQLGGVEYVAWATTPMLRPWVRLGTVRPGHSVTGRVAFDRFMIFVSAEADTLAAERAGRLVLRGGSASMRMLPMDDPVLLMGAASPAETPGAAAAGGHAAHGKNDGWVVPPHDSTLLMPPGMMALRPTASPFLPDTTGHMAIPDALPREVLRLRDGDTITLTAGLVRRTIAGKPVVMYAFNGQQPGPLLHVTKGATIVVNFRNDLDVPSAVHWHGVRLDNRFDGVPHVTQDPVPPGGSFRYVVHFRDAGIYWYHPHHREDTQQDLGLYGNMLVDPGPGAYNTVDREESLILDDMLLGDGGLVPYGREAATDALMGRFGNVMLVNGAPDYRMAVRAGDVVRLFLTNASNTRTFNVSFGDDARIRLIGSDVGRFEREEWVESVVLAPAERYIVEVQFAKAGRSAMVNRVRAIDHVAGRFFQVSDTLMTVDVQPSTGTRSTTALRTHDDVIAEIAQYRKYFGRPVDHHLTLSVRAKGLPRTIELMMRNDSSYFNPVEWHGTMGMMSWVSTTREVQWLVREQETGRENMDIAWHFRQGDVVKLRITNDRSTIHAMQHPIHIHGQRFLVIARNGVPTDNLVWKDTILVPAGQTADVLLELSNPGRWMLHCHIAEHMEAGMMMLFDVAGN